MPHGTTDKRFTQPLGGAGGFSLTAKGGIHTFDTADAELAVGADGEVLTADSAESLGIKWAAAAGGVGTGTSLAILGRIDPRSVASPNAEDDEFLGSSIDTSKWTRVARGSPVGTWGQNHGRSSWIKDDPAAAASELDVFMQSYTPSVGDVLEVAVRFSDEDPNIGAWVGFADGTTFSTDDALGVWIHSSPTGHIRPLFNFWGGFDSRTADGTLLDIDAGQPDFGWFFVRIEYEAANTWGFEWSHDGIHWTVGQTGYAGTLTPTHIGFGTGMLATATEDSTISHAYFRLNPPKVGVAGSTTAAGLAFNSLHTPPSPADPLDDEFDDGVISGAWSSFNVGSAVFTESLDGGYLHMTTPGAVGPDVRGLAQTAPAAPYTLTVPVALGGELVANGAAGIGFRDTGTGRLLQIYLVNFASDTALEVTKWTSPTVYSSSPIVPEHNSNTMDAFFQIENDGVDLILRFGDGVVWIEAFREAIGTFLTPDEVIMAITQVGTNPGRDTEGVFYWSRWNWDADDSLKRDIGGGGGGETVVPENSRIARLYSRESGDTPHADDLEFEDGYVLDGTEIAPTGTSLWTPDRHMLGFEFSAVSASDLLARVWPLTPVTFPVTIEAAVHSLLNNDNFHQWSILFSDGNTATDDLVRVGLHRAGAVVMGDGTFTALNGASVVADRFVPFTGNPFYIRLAWTAANTFQGEYSSDGLMWTTLGHVAGAVTLTPTYFGIGGTSWGSAGKSELAVEYIRIYESDLTA